MWFPVFYIHWVYKPSLSMTQTDQVMLGYPIMFKPWDMDCVCVPFRGLMVKTKYLSAFLQGDSSRWQAHQFECRELQGCCVFLHAQQFPVCIKNGTPPKGQAANLTQLWEELELTLASITMQCFQHLVVHALTNWGCSEGKRGCNSILGRCS